MKPISVKINFSNRVLPRQVVELEKVIQLLRLDNAMKREKLDGCSLVFETVRNSGELLTDIENDHRKTLTEFFYALFP